jgi:formylmethanofuran dehydrogenase subunit B
MRATLRERSTLFAAARSKELDDLLSRLRRSRYVVLVYDAEPGAPSRDPLRAEALIALTQALNQPTRAALIGLRAGGNRVGAETALTSQTGYPLSVTYDRGWPGYEPGTRAVTGVNQGRFGAVLLVGTADADQALVTVPSDVSTIVIGPRASRSPLRPTVAIDTGIAGIHEGGTAYRLDDVPLRLRPPLQGPRTTTGVLEALIQAVSSAPNPGTP